ncbi:MAG: glycosyltransferase [Planctomycetes bacterium]|nr:glycosyltransferase [Planctomycetota bacterium]
MCIAVSFDDAVRGCARALTHQAQWGRRGVVVLLADVAGDRAAPADAEVRVLGLAPGAVGAHPELVSRLRALIEECAPAIIYAPAPGAADPDRRAACHAVASALASGPRRDLAWYEGERSHRTPVTDSREALAALSAAKKPITDALAATAVVSTWNKRDDVRINLESLRAQTLPFAEIVVVDNHSSDGTAEMIKREFPEVRLIEMPHDKFGACETFNIGFKASRTALTAILDDDIVMPPNWLEKATARIEREPATTAILSTQVVEPGMPEEYKHSKSVNEERYMSTFRGCASLARSRALQEAGYYDERLFIYGNERDLTCRLLNLGYRVLQYPGCGVFHRTPFGIKMGKRSLYYHARNAWLSMLKYAPLADLARMPWLVVKVVFRSDKREAEGEVRDAVGTIGIGKSLRETKGAWWVVTKAALNVFVNIPYCLKHRRPVKSPDFELPIH